ncbi:hypothetical protein DXT09_03340 [Escherichia coli]|uniref:Uncharacterized protein n=1 Tax=Escherichia coli TaxID=562 RepID=A0A1Q6B7Q9_ECOLX|nr:hypothetical protein [Escherichia coli]KDA56118.1 hypothetical protein AA98_3856 [Escherichia coli 2-011-08_S1_C1]BDI52799.1 hypothetical protein EsCd1KSP079_04051 [Escherichia sp. KS167_9B]EGO9211280.1 hypothetical protein [Escherichia coli]OKU95487.1 hypothetical protein AWP53_26115 [Escherichia coli]
MRLLLVMIGLRSKIKWHSGICRERAILGDFVICLNVLLQSVAKLHFKGDFDHGIKSDRQVTYISDT